MGLIIHILITSLAVYFTAWLLPGINITNYPSAILVAVVLGLLDAFLKPILTFISFPITIITFGLFLLVINAIIILIASYLVGSFKVDSFWWALLFSIIVSLVSGVMRSVVRS